ncbi:hypothetical protein O181_055116 [Austropuccinia psidii MF-1]|uniref:Extracellular membrane protein CFEM domain-containing protein n=1 Tax=Austropuccinia psidii MF-1 TaxID=1389203 RepID=A0A9Q3E3S5_9BASI|nr:hypothetical protein [Austropuccinia psidii MF-1]
MFNPTWLILLLSVIPTNIIAQTTSTNTSNSSPAASTNASTNTSANTQTNTQTTNTSENNPASTTSNAQTNGGTPFTAPVVTGTTCGSNQQNFNQCVNKVSKDISGCSPTDNLCLCQTYANLAYCYNACSDLADQGSQYKSQSTQYCSAPGGKANATTSTTSNLTSTTTTPLNTSSTQPTSNTPTNRTSSSTPASTFAASKSGALNSHAISHGLLSSLVAFTWVLLL